MSRKLAYYEVLYELGKDEDFVEEVIAFLNKVDHESAYSEANAITGLLDYWLSNGELNCYQFDELILNEEIAGGIVYGDSDKSNESLHRTLTFDDQELINKLKSEGLVLPRYLKEQEEFSSICLKKIDWKDWISRKHILIYEALLLLKEIDPDYFEDPEQFDEDDEFVLQTRQWIEDKVIIPQVTFIDGGPNEYRIEPVAFFNLIDQSGRGIPKELREILNGLQSQQSASPCGDIQPPQIPVNTVGIDGATPNKVTLSKLGKQQNAILEVIKSKGFVAMKIPDGEKSKTIQKACENEHATLFKGSTSFDRAWSKGVGELWQMEHHESYARRGIK